MSARSIELRGAENNRLAAALWGGQGRPVLLLHGGGQTRHAWDETARRIADEGMRAIAVDLRGHGSSEWVASCQYGFRHFAADVEAVCRQVERMFRTRPSGRGRLARRPLGAGGRGAFRAVAGIACPRRCDTASRP